MRLGERCDQMKCVLLCAGLVVGMSVPGLGQGQVYWKPSRVELTPLPHAMVSMTVDGVNFWANQAKAAGRIRQKQWLAYEDGDE
jgi:hypothetical protein